MREARLPRRILNGQGASYTIGAPLHWGAEFRHRFPVSKICEAFGLNNLIGFGAGGKKIFQVDVITNTALTTFTVPSTWNNSANKIEGIGGGERAGGGGAYAVVLNAALTPSSSIAIAVGKGGVLSVSPTDSTVTSILVAKAATGSVGGAAASCTPTTGAHSGGNIGTGGGGNGAPGGGAGGPTGDGQPGGAGSCSGGPGGAAGTGSLASGYGTISQGPGAGATGGISGTCSPCCGNPGGGAGAAGLYGGGGGVGGGRGARCAPCEPNPPIGQSSNGAQGILVFSHSYNA